MGDSLDARGSVEVPVSQVRCFVGYPWRRALGGEGQLDAAGGVALVAGRALATAVVVQVAAAGAAGPVALPVEELPALHVHLDLLCRGHSQGLYEAV